LEITSIKINSQKMKNTIELQMYTLNSTTFLTEVDTLNQKNIQGGSTLQWTQVQGNNNFSVDAIATGVGNNSSIQFVNILPGSNNNRVAQIVVK
jgi:hypothetical protein